MKRTKLAMFAALELGITVFLSVAAGFDCVTSVRLGFLSVCLFLFWVGVWQYERSRQL